MGSGARTTGSTLSAVAEEYRPVVNTLPEVTQLLLGQERHCQDLLDVLQPDQGQGVPQVVSLCGAPGAGMLPFTPRFDMLSSHHALICCQLICPLLNVSEADSYADVRGSDMAWPRHASEWFLCAALGADSLPQLACSSLSNSLDDHN